MSSEKNEKEVIPSEKDDIPEKETIPPKITSAEIKDLPDEMQHQIR